ncbi:Gfo/Idh/MocA family protein [Cellulomonas sp. PhB143]|uniref:Gfo/Idh/MocA family protein n=1 Tax=Cellulomonas sp. PhB143 TaxID=2485186 RepID=UPI000F497EF6|nr:Gfo/Idh/MocA family oxidoreductase [Cellulomonas sp. PhB143]ROS76612.1 putative dehydrogenase [Cellulomonas sp. PhB143]
MTASHSTPSTPTAERDELLGSVPDPASAPPVRWGVLGAGWIAGVFAGSVREGTASSVVAVGSRDADKAQAFADEHAPGARAHGSYEDLVADPEVDVVYVASPHSHHHEHALLAVRAGKHVLVEKAFTRNEAEAREVLDAAREAGVFVMEAMWTRFLPHVAAIRAAIARGEIGDVVNVSAAHGQAFPLDPGHRLYAPELAGGALLDLGVYPIAFAHDLLGAPDAVTAVGALTETGVDGQVSIVLSHGPRAQSTLQTSLWAVGENGAVVTGSRGRIEVDGWFYTPTGFRVVRDDGVSWTYEGFAGEGKEYEAAEVARCVAAGLTESPRMTWDDTLAIIRTMDEVRRQVGVAYPGE